MTINDGKFPYLLLQNNDLYVRTMNVLLQKGMYVLYICYNITRKPRVKTTLMYRLILWTEEIRSNSQGFILKHYFNVSTSY